MALHKLVYIYTFHFDLILIDKIAHEIILPYISKTKICLSMILYLILVEILNQNIYHFCFIYIFDSKSMISELITYDNSLINLMLKNILKAN